MSFLTYNGQTIVKFYGLVNKSAFLSISPERREELDRIVEGKMGLLTSNIITIPVLMTHTAEKLITSSKNFGLRNSDEMAYFYIMIVDPDLKFLEAFESASKVDELKEYCFNNFRIYDKTIIGLEKRLNRRFNIIGIPDLWARDSIDKTRRK